ncbi:hypothetical protein [Neptuniibacter marinus]|uniref:hypothetical protein n=1 Tax=Neptuniibacter marinus TaxID=1806670 RepID=UPI003B5B6159
MECIGPFTCIWFWLGENVAAIIAASAMGATLWQGYIARKHNRLSVKPHLVVHSTLSLQSPQIAFAISNDGLGPAIFQSYTLSIYDTELTPDDTIEEITRIIQGYGHSSATSITLRGWHAGESYKQGAYKEAFEVYGDFGTDKAQLDDVRKLLKNITIKINYSSIYGEEFKLTFRNNKTSNQG